MKEILNTEYVTVPEGGTIIDINTIYMYICIYIQYTAIMYIYIYI